MMTLMKKALKNLVLTYIVGHGGLARALDVFDCVRDLIPVTEQAAFQGRRKSVEKPFMLNGKFMVFPEIAGPSVAGFYIYSAGGKGVYYDAIEQQEPKPELRSLVEIPPSDHSMYELVAQPNGLETITIRYMPGYGYNDTTGKGPMLLGATLLPVVGAFVSRSAESLHLVYHNPAGVDEADLKKWVYEHTSRRPANVNDIEIQHKILRLATKKPKTGAALTLPLQEEFKLRKTWVQNHNLDEASFKKLSRVMEGSCRE